ncbi:TPA: 50S ribosomal protein L14 [Candidatus Gracilibacteria bacterium]|nr:50S ribosomal protein L14 [Candidatus Gracilibacteria bacterium]
MVQTQSMLSVADNSGAKEVMCIKVLGGSKRRYAQVGDVIVVTVRVASPKGAVKRKSIQRAVVVRQRNTVRRPNGSFLRFDENAVVILNSDGQPRGTRVFGPIANEVRTAGYQKIISMASEIF